MSCDKHGLNNMYYNFAGKHNTRRATSTEVYDAGLWCNKNGGKPHGKFLLAVLRSKLVCSTHVYPLFCQHLTFVAQNLAIFKDWCSLILVVFLI